MRSAEDPDPPAPAGDDPGVRSWPRRAAIGLVLAVAVVAFARGASSEVRYETDPSAAEPLARDQIDALARSSAGTRCGGWPAALSTSEPPEVPPLHTVVWADAEAFHVRSSHLFVRAARFDVEGGTAVAAGLEPQASLSVPVQPGATVDVTISCGATGVTVHLLGGDGKDVGEAALAIGARGAEPAPRRVVKGRADATPAACTDLATAAAAVDAATTDQARLDAARLLLQAARAARSAADESLSDDERDDADTVLALFEARLAELEAGDPASGRPASDAEEAATAGVARMYERLCG